MTDQFACLSCGREIVRNGNEQSVRCLGCGQLCIFWATMSGNFPKLPPENYMSIKTNVRHLTGLEMMNWPEFKVFMRRLGIDTNTPMRSVNIWLKYDRVPEIEICYIGRDTGSEKLETSSADTPVVFDLDCGHPLKT